MPSRADLQTLLASIPGVAKVYFQPPESIELVYPAIVFKYDNIKNDFADDSVYRQSWYYRITVIDKNSDSEIMKAVSKLPSVKFNRYFVSDNLNHYVFTIYY
jgi:hypothetical protein